MKLSSLLKFYPKNYKSNIEFNKWYNFIDKSQWWTEEQHNAYQWQSLKDLLEFVYNKIPYYQEVFKKLNATPQDIKSFGDFRQFPFLTKDIIRERLDDMVPPGISRKKLVLYNTGGSTGIPLAFYKTKRDDIIEKAFMTSQWARIGYRRQDSRIIMRGEVLKNGKLWEQSKVENIWKFSAYQLSLDNIKAMVDKINELQPQFIHVYPTSLQLFTQLAREANLKLNYTPVAILSGSEKLFDYQRKLFEEFYHCRVYTWLGLAEQTTLAGECEYSNKLHVFSEHSYVELIDHDGTVIQQDGIPGEIVGTRFHRFIIPFIRYRSGDIAQYYNESCQCNRHYKILDGVEGRVQDVVVTSDLKKIPVTALFFGQHLSVFEKSKKIQLEQNKPGELLIRIIKGKGYSVEDERQLIEKLNLATEGKMIFTIYYVDEMEITSRGKHKFLISSINQEFI